jgi:hypothetical protein
MKCFWKGRQLVAKSFELFRLNGACSLELIEFKLLSNCTWGRVFFSTKNWKISSASCSEINFMKSSNLNFSFLFLLFLDYAGLLQRGGKGLVVDVKLLVHIIGLEGN